MNKKRSTGFESSLAGRLTALLLAAALTVLTVTPVTTVPAEAASTTTWGVFIGATIHGNTWKVKNYKSIVIDAQNYTKAEIKKLYGEHFGSTCSKSLSCMDVCPMNIPTIASMAKLNK